MFSPDALDRKLNDAFPGRVVRQNLVRQIKVGANAPTYVLEYLLGKYCATEDPVAVEAGLRLENSTLAENVIRPDEVMKAQSRVKERGHQSYIDKRAVRLDSTKYWAKIVNFGQRFVHIPDHFVRQYERLLEAGIWAQGDVEFRGDEENGFSCHVVALFCTERRFCSPISVSISSSAGVIRTQSMSS